MRNFNLSQLEILHEQCLMCREQRFKCPDVTWSVL